MIGIISNQASAPTISMQDAIKEIKNATVQSAMTAMFADAKADVSQFRQNIETWFNSSMDRVSGWYKRRTQLILFLMGLGIAVALNVNSVSLAGELWSHKAQRD